MSVSGEYSRIAADDHGWSKEFQNINETCKKYGYTFIEAKKPENSKYNRYMDICPYDHSRIILNKSHSYINANIVEVERANKRYILTQGPTDSSTPHFWRMVWEHDCKAIVMLNKRIENDRIKCSMYWPGNVGPDHAIHFPDVGLRIEQLTDESHACYSTRVMRITATDTDSSREVIQFHYVTWPDFGVPSSPTAFLEFLYDVRASGAMDSNVGPPVIHCSAGVGRSGTFCLVDSCLVLIEKYGEDNVNVKEVLLEMRKYRMGLIQTPDQLRFSYQAIIKGAQQMLGAQDIKQNGDDINEIMNENSKEENGDAPPVPPPRAASLKLNSTHSSDADDLTSDSDNSQINGDVNVNDYQPPTRELPDVPSDSDEEKNEDSDLNQEVMIEEEKNPDPTKIIDHEDEKVRRRALLTEKSEKLQERIQEMKRKQQKAEYWQQKKRSLYIPMIIGFGIAVFAIAYMGFKN